MDNLKKYVDDQRAAGVSDVQIQQELISAGWDQAMIDNFFRSTETSGISENTNNNQNASQVVSTSKPKWLWWVSGIILLIIIGVGLLLLINPNLPAGSDLLKRQALTTFLQKGEEVFKKDGQVLNSGLCVFMSMNQSYKESVSDPTWEFQCFDSDRAYAAQLRLNDGTYRCVDSEGGSVEAKQSVIYGPQCLQEGDSRLNDGSVFPTTMTFSGATLPVNVTQTTLPTELPASLQVLSNFTCGNFFDEAADTSKKLQESFACLDEAFKNDCQTASFRMNWPLDNEIQTRGVTKRNNNCTYVFIEPSMTTSLRVQCDIDKLVQSDPQTTAFYAKQSAQPGLLIGTVEVGILDGIMRRYDNKFKDGVHTDERFVPAEYNKEKYMEDLRSGDRKYSLMIGDMYRQNLKKYMETELNCEFFIEPNY